MGNFYYYITIVLLMQEYNNWKMQKKPPWTYELVELHTFLKTYIIIYYLKVNELTLEFYVWAQICLFLSL